MSKAPNHFYEFSSFRLEPGKRQLMHDGQRVSLPPKAFDTLLILVESRGQAIKKDDLINQVWPDSYVDENNLNQYVSLLRKRLGGDSKSESFIETVPRWGYRFVADVQERWDEETEVALHRSTSAQIVIREETTEGSRQKAEGRERTAVLSTLARHRIAASVVAVGLVSIIFAGVSIRWLSARSSRALAGSHDEDVRQRVRAAFTMIDDEGRGEEAIPILRDVLKSDPNNALAHWSLSEAYRYGGMLDESIAEGELAIRLDPKVIQETTLNTYFYAGKYENFLKSTEGQPDFPRTKFYRGLVYLYLNDSTHAIAEFDRATELSPTLFHSQLGQAFRAAITGNQKNGIKILQQLEREDVPHDGELFYKVAQAYALLGDKRSALRVLRLSIERSFFCLPYIIQDPFLESLHADPEYIQLTEYAGKRHEEFKRKFF